MTPAQLSVIFFLELFAIVAAARTVGWLASASLASRRLSAR